MQTNDASVNTCTALRGRVVCWWCNHWQLQAATVDCSIVGCAGSLLFGSVWMATACWLDHCHDRSQRCAAGLTVSLLPSLSLMHLLMHVVHSAKPLVEPVDIVWCVSCKSVGESSAHCPVINRLEHSCTRYRSISMQVGLQTGPGVSHMWLVLSILGTKFSSHRGGARSLVMLVRCCCIMKFTTDVLHDVHVGSMLSSALVLQQYIADWAEAAGCRWFCCWGSSNSLAVPTTGAS